MKIFSRLSSLEISELILLARSRIIYAAPGIHKDVSDSIIQSVEQVGNEKIVTIVDADPNVCRFGFGSIDAVEDLLRVGIAIRKANGLRIGVLVVDNRAWLFSPTPLLIEDQFNVSCINAITVTLEQGMELISTISPDLIDDKDENMKLEHLHNKKTIIIPEIGHEDFVQEDLNEAKKDLIEYPPKQFDFERKVSVYTSHIQFVELSLQGLQLNRRTLTIPPKLLNVSNNKEAQERLKATYGLIDNNSKYSSNEIDQELSKIRKIYLRSVGKRLGSVILIQKKGEFLEEIKKLRESILNLNVTKNLEDELEKSKKELCKILLPGIMNNPPDDLKGAILTKKPDKKTAMKYLNAELEKVIPNVDELVNNINLYCDFKDITIEMLKDKFFQNNLRKQFPYVLWPKPFNEYDAVQERKKTTQLELALE